MIRGEKLDAWILSNCRVREDAERNKWVILGLDEKSRNTNPVSELDCGLSAVVVRSVSEAEGGSSQKVVELEDAMDALECIDWKQLRAVAVAFPQALLHPAEKAPLVNPVFAGAETVYASREIDGRRNSGDSGEIIGSRFP